MTYKSQINLFLSPFSTIILKKHFEPIYRFSGNFHFMEKKNRVFQGGIHVISYFLYMQKFVHGHKITQEISVYAKKIFRVKHFSDWIQREKIRKTRENFRKFGRFGKFGKKIHCFSWSKE